MTNTQIMELLRNEAINKDTKKALLIAAGIIAVGGIAIYYYNKHQNSIITSLNTRHTNFLNFSENKFNELDSTVSQKDNIIAEQATIIRQLQDENIILQNIKNIQSDKA
jgi:hypothetical protein